MRPNPLAESIPRESTSQLPPNRCVSLFNYDEIPTVLYMLKAFLVQSFFLWYHWLSNDSFFTTKLAIYIFSGKNWLH